MPPQNGVDPETIQRASDVIETLAKVAGSLGIVWAFVAKVLVPYRRWKDAHRAREIREALKPELDAFADLLHPDEGWKARLDRVEKTLDKLVPLALDNQNRHDETNELLDALGFTSDRRGGKERREQELREMVEELNSERRHFRRRSTDE